MRVRVVVRGTVQGVGFRPFVRGEACARGLAGWIANGADGVTLELEGPQAAIEEVIGALERVPSPARIERVVVEEKEPRGETGFEIRAGEAKGERAMVLPPDLAVCAECLGDVEREGDRREGYPFTACTRCGPRHTIAAALPWARERTAMVRFALCEACARERDDPRDRRHHAEPIACPRCGPRLALVDPSGVVLAREGEALLRAADAIAEGQIVALKGLGGFQLLCDAQDAGAVARLRARKGRPSKPFALLVGSLTAARALCEVSREEAALLASSENPIVLLRRTGGAVADGVAPGASRLGLMLPTTPLHHLLARRLARPLVCTSGNRAEEPLCIDLSEAKERLAGIADLFLAHDRPILRAIDDSVVRVDRSGTVLLRRARGWVPRPLALPVGRSVLALGAELKSTVTLLHRGQAIVSQHLGDQSSLEARRLLERTARDLLAFFAARPDALACDLHPDLGSTALAERLSQELALPLVRVQHHHAHVAAVLAEHGRGAEPVLGLAWDGAGFGTDGSVWGGEALVVRGASFERVARLRSFALPGGERAFRDPRRAALGLLAAAGLEPPCFFPPGEQAQLLTALGRGLNSPRTSSLGRLFDAVACLAGLEEAGRPGHHEAEAAIAFERAAEEAPGEPPYPFPLVGGEADWGPLVTRVLEDRRRGELVARIASRFHAALVELAAAIAHGAGQGEVALTGGCFQNALLLESVRERLEAAGLRVLVPREYPPNDGAISLGQAWVASTL